MRLTVRVDDWGHGQHSVLRVVDDRVHGRVSDERKELGKMTVGLSWEKADPGKGSAHGTAKWRGGPSDEPRRTS